MLKEKRLIGYTTTINPSGTSVPQQGKPNLTPIVTPHANAVTDPYGGNSTTSSPYLDGDPSKGLDPAKYPDANYRAAVESNLAGAKGTPSTRGSFIDPATGQDTRATYDKNGKPTFQTDANGRVVGGTFTEDKNATYIDPATGKEKKASSSSTPTKTATAPTPKIKVLSGQDLNDAAAKKREDNLKAAGLGQDNELRQILDKGGVNGGKDINGIFFKMPDGSKVYYRGADTTTEGGAAKLNSLINAYNANSVDKVKSQVDADQMDAIAQQRKDERQTAADSKSSADALNPDGTPKVDVNGNPLPTPGGTNTAGGGTGTSDTITGGTTPTKGSLALDGAMQDVQNSLNTIKGLSPETYNAYLPAINSRLSQIQDLQGRLKTTNESDVTQDPTVVAAQKNLDEVKLEQDARLAHDEQISQDAEQIKLDTAKDVKEAADLDTQIMKQKQDQDEQAQMALNVQNEAQKRRELIKAGVADDTNGLTALSNTIQAGVSKLASLRNPDSLAVLKANLVSGDAYTKSVNEALNTYESDRARLEAGRDDKIKAARDVVTQNTASAQKQKKEDAKELMKQIGDLETAAADKITEAQKTLTDNTYKNQVHQDAMDQRDATRAASKDAKATAQDEKDFTLGTAAIEKAKSYFQNTKSEVKVYQETKQYNDNFNSAYDLATKDGATSAERAAGYAQALLQFSHGQNPGSLRIQDLAADETKENQSFLDKFKAGIIHHAIGGDTLTEEGLKAAKALSDSAASTQKTKALNEINGQWADIQRINNLYMQHGGTNTAITPSQIIDDPELLSAFHQPANDGYDPDGDSSGTSDNPFGDSSTQGSPTSMRTDRNNNPTAMTTDLAKQAGLQEGVDYQVGDSFPGDNSMHTAKLLGDPVATTIKAIDNVGFTTKSGAPRWTYLSDLGVTNDSWKGMTKDQKVAVIKNMYKHEGGNGSLFATTNNQV